MADKLKGIFELARAGGLEAIGIHALPVVDNWAPTDDFPTSAFVIRGPNSIRLYNWGENRLAAWNDGDVDVHQFIEDQGATLLAENSGSHLHGLEASQTISFEFPASSIDFVRPSNLTITSTGCLASVGGWFTPNHIEWAGSASVAKVVSGSKLWLISNELSLKNVKCYSNWRP